MRCLVSPLCKPDILEHSVLFLSEPEQYCLQLTVVDDMQRSYEVAEVAGP
jgi:hypothetical protein